jgi:pilus assembly protein CpaE
MAGIVLAHVPEPFAAGVRAAYGAHLNGSLRRWDGPLDTMEPEDAARSLAASQPDVVALGPLAPLDGSLQVARVLDRLFPHISVVLVTEPAADLWRQALQAGARDVIAPDADWDTLVGAFDAALEIARVRSACAEARSPAVSPVGRIITVTSPKGGSGKTVIATNLAVALARSAPGDVVLVDLDVQFGDVANVLHLDPTYDVSHLAKLSHLDSTTMKTALTPHPSQLLVLCAPAEPQDAEDVTPAATERILRLLAELFRYVVVDTGGGLDDLTLAAVEVADDAIVVSSTDVPSINALRKELHIFERLGFTASRRFVLNRSDARVGLIASDIEATTGLRIEAAVPSSRAVPTSVNQGVPLIEMDARSVPARVLSSFARSFLPPNGEERVTAPARPLWRRSAR